MRIAIALAAAIAMPGIVAAANAETTQTVEPTPAPAAPAPNAGPWYSKLSLLAEEARKRGYELPLPFGTAAVLTGLSGRKIEVTDVRLAVEGGMDFNGGYLIVLAPTYRFFATAENR